MSVGRRLSVLVLFEAITSIVLVGVALAALGAVTSHNRYTDRFILAPIGETSAAIEDIDEVARGIRDHVPVEQLQTRLDNVARFLARYRANVQTVGNHNPDAHRLVEELANVQQLGMLEEERTILDRGDQLVASMSSALSSPHPPTETLLSDARRLRQIVLQILELNVRFGSISQGAAQRIANHSTEVIWLFGVVSLAAGLLLSLRVRWSIAPRVQRLVAKVRHFQDAGILTRIEEPGQDELGVLNNALDIGFASILTRDRDRERFLSVAAHELKTPISSIQGFAQAALAKPDSGEVRDRALRIIDKQAKRMSRLVEDLFLASRARSGQLPFSPSPTVLGDILEQIVADVRSMNPEARIELDIANRTSLLIDETLISHALWTMLTYAATRVRAGGSTRVFSSVTDQRAVVELRPQGPSFTPEEIETVFAPFTALQYEGTGERKALGLYLCREVARIHNGRVRVHNDLDGSPVLTFELPGAV